jgi:predicted nucleic acid-binding protein
VRFWDSSALVPLIVRQTSSPRSDEWFGADDQIAIWTLTPVEIVSAVRRLRREGSMTDRAARDAEVRIDELTRASHVVIDVEAVKTGARRLLRLHPLRAADALQLAAALEWAAGAPTGRVLHTLDDRLGRAAQTEGFEVIPEPR